MNSRIQRNGLSVDVKRCLRRFNHEGNVRPLAKRYGCPIAVAPVIRAPVVVPQFAIRIDVNAGMVA